MKIKCMLDNKGYNDKPQGKEIGAITNRLATEKVEIEINKLAEKLIKGHTFKPAVVGKKEAEWMEQILFALDFDENTTIDSELNRCKELNILPVFAYTSFSHQEDHHKFRLVFCANEVITNYETAKTLQLTLMNIFINCDEKCKNISRLFFGGRKLIYTNYNNTINYKEIIDKYSIKIEEGFSPRKIKDNTIIPIISSGEKPLGEDSKYYNLKALRDRNVEYLKNKINNPKIILENNQAFFNYIKGYDLGDLLEIKYPNSFRCILHEDNNPSAGIFQNEEGTYLYHCFSCGVSYNIINLIEVLGNFKSRPKAYKFMREIFNIEIQETEFQKEQKELLDENLRVLINGELEKNCPITYKNISRNIKYLSQLLLIAKDNVYNEKFTDSDDNIVFYASNTYICKLLNMSENSSTEISKKNALFAYHMLLNKLEDSEIPDEILKRSQAINANDDKYRKHINCYSIPSYNTIAFKEIEAQGEKWKENNYSMTGISREMFYRGEGLEVANWLYPQHTHVYDKEQEQTLDRTTTSKSNERTDEIVKIIFSILEIQPYVTEKYIIDELSASGDVPTTKKEAEKQLKKSLQEILLTYNLVRLRCNKDIKKLYNVESEGYPFIIVKNVE
jgi:hypothetical protein